MNLRKSFLLRVDPNLFKQLEAWAEQEFRSVNGQIEFLLREAVSRRRGGREEPPALPGNADGHARREA